MWKSMWLIALLVSARSPLAAEEKSVVFEMALNPESEMAQGLVKAMTVILEKEGYHFSARPFPSKRGLQELRSGRVDGTLVRIGDLPALQDIKDVVRIDFPVYVLTGDIYCGKGAAQARPLKLGVRLGNILAAKMVDAIDNQNVEVEELATYRSVVEMLKSGRLNCILTNPAILEAENIPVADLEKFERKSLIAARGYAWISHRYKHLKPLIEKGLAQYPFAEEYHKKYHSQKPVCQGEYSVLCPDGVIYKKVIDFRPALEGGKPLVRN